MYLHLRMTMTTCRKPSTADNDVQAKKVEYGTFTVLFRSEHDGMLKAKHDVDAANLRREPLMLKKKRSRLNLTNKGQVPTQTTW